MYALFCHAVYYPSGGWGDFIGLYTTIESAIEAAQKWETDEYSYPRRPWQYSQAHVVDTNTLTKVWEIDEEGASFL